MSREEWVTLVCGRSGVGLLAIALASVLACCFLGHVPVLAAYGPVSPAFSDSETTGFTSAESGPAFAPGEPILSVSLLHDVCIVEVTGVPVNLSIPWLLPPVESYLPGILIADPRLGRVLERTGAQVRVLGEYVESNTYYLVQTSPLITERSLSTMGDVLWSGGNTHLLAVDGSHGDAAALPGVRASLLHPTERSLASMTSALPSPGAVTGILSPLSYSQTENLWIDWMVEHVSQDRITTHIRRLSGEEAIVVVSGRDTIRTRYSYHTDCLTAAEYLYAQFDSMGIDVAYDYYAALPLTFIEFKDDEGYIGGGGGTIYYTPDGGETWEEQNSGTTQPLWRTSFVAPDTCWVSGGAGTLAHTTDGAAWELLASGTGCFLYGVKFVNSQTGWVCGDLGEIRRTIDGGLTWSPQLSGTSERLYDIEATSADLVWAVGNAGTILHTTDGGQTWHPQVSNTDARLYDACFVNSKLGWAVGTSGVILHTSDGGVNWVAQSSGITNTLLAVSFVDSLCGWATGSSGTVVSTRDGGVSWASRQIPPFTSLYGVSFVDALRGGTVGASLITRTDDGGESWVSLSENVPSQWCNVVATLPGVENPARQYIVCAHYDDTSNLPMANAPGADDNATGTSLVLEAAGILKEFPFRSSIKFICFSGEEQGLAGSSHYASEAGLAGDDIGGVLNFDMVGYGTPTAYLYGNPSSEWLVDYCITVRDNFVPWLSLMKDIDPTMRYSDHYSFWKEGYSALMGIELDYETNPYYHTTGDSIDTLSLPFTADVTRLAVASLASLAELDTVTVAILPEPAARENVSLGANYPNPFNPGTLIPFSLPATDRVVKYSLAILDPAGRIVRILEKGHTGLAPLEKRVFWDGRDESGRPVASGIYLSYLSCGDQSKTRKIVLAR